MRRKDLEYVSNDHRAASVDDSVHRTSSERLSKVNATPNNMPREGEKNVSFSASVSRWEKSAHVDVNSLIFPADENAG